MYSLQIEHPVPNFDAWRRAFESDPVNRKQSGVRRYWVLRPIDNPNYAIIDLEFDSVNKAEGLLAALRAVWRGVQGAVTRSLGQTFSVPSQPIHSANSYRCTMLLLMRK